MLSDGTLVIGKVSVFGFCFSSPATTASVCRTILHPTISAAFSIFLTVSTKFLSANDFPYTYSSRKKKCICHPPANNQQINFLYEILK